MTSVAASNRPSRTKWQRILALSIVRHGERPLVENGKAGKHENEAGPVAAKRERKRVGD